MARAAIVHTWADGSRTRVEVEVDNDYPDSLSEAVARVLDLWAAAAMGEDAE